MQMTLYHKEKLGLAHNRNANENYIEETSLIPG